MIRIENLRVYGFESAIRGMRNPMNSWDRSDSKFENSLYTIGDNDITLMKKLVKAGSDHRKFLRMIQAYFDITAPLYWWKEFDTYKVGTVANSCSTMHKLCAKEFTKDDFSYEYILKNQHAEEFFETEIDLLNSFRNQYLRTKSKTVWYQMIQMLPSSYNQKRTVMLNYETLLEIYISRKKHKLDEWNEFRDWEIEELPYFNMFAEDE